MPNPSLPQNDPEQLARILLGPDATPEEIAQMLASISQGMPPEQPQPAPSGSASDWTASLPSKLHPLGRSGTSIGGAAAMAAAPFLSTVPGPGPELAGAAFNGGLSALADGSPAEISRSGLEGALGGAASRIYGPAIAGAAGKMGPPIRRALGMNDQLVDDALAKMAPSDFWQTLGGPAAPSMPEDMMPPPANIEQLLQNQPVMGIPPMAARPRMAGFAGRAGGTARMRPPAGLSDTQIRRR